MSRDSVERPAGLLRLTFGVTFVLTLAATLVWTSFGLPRAGLVSYTCQSVMSFFSVIASADAARRLRGRQRLAWIFVVLAVTLIFLGTIDGDILVASGSPVAPTTPSATFQELALPFSYGGILLFVASFLRMGRVRTVFDSFIAVIGVTCLAWVLGLGDLYAASHQDPATRLFSILYPMVDVLYFAPLLFLTLTVPRRHKSSLGLFSMALISSVIPDLNYAAMCALGQPYRAGYPIELGWVGAFGLIAFAALQAREIKAEDVAPRKSSMWRTALPYVAVGLCGVALAYQEATKRHVDGLMIGGLVALTVLLSFRQILELRENQSLSEALREQSVRRAEQRFATLVENSSDVILVVDHELLIRYASGAVRHLLGVSPEELHGRSLDAVVYDEDVEEVLTHLRHITDGDEPHRLEFRVTTPEGDWRYLEALPSNLFSDGNINGIVLNTRDVTERRELEMKLRRDAAHDPLTGLANRKTLIEHLEHALALAHRRNGTVGLLFIDLDGFKGVNDTAGHVVGDKVLKVVAERLQNCVRSADMVCRYGGDEFAVVLDDCESAEGPYILAQKIRSVVMEQIVFRGFRRSVGASIGITLSVEDDDVMRLISRADAVMYKAKHSGTAIEVDAAHQTALTVGGPRGLVERAG